MKAKAQKIRMGPLGMQEMIAIFVIALLLFGPKKLPELGRMLGKAISEFRRAKNELKTTFESHLQELERETRMQEPNPPKTDYSPSHYSYPYEDYNYDASDSSSYRAAYESGEHEHDSTSSNGTALEKTEPPQEEVAQSSRVAGTVPRNNGVHSVEPLSASHEEDGQV